MSGSFFWFAIFPMILGGILFAVYIIFLNREGAKPEEPESRRMTVAEFISQVGQYSNIDAGEAERIVKFVFSYFPGFDWRKNLPRMKDRRTSDGHEDGAERSEAQDNQKQARLP